MDLHKHIANELSINLQQVSATVSLLNEGATVPFIARYRKEATGGLTDTQLRELAERLTYLTELQERKDAVIKSIEEQGKLTPSLKDDILKADTKTRVEDLYLPYKKKRQTKAELAKQAGILPLAEMLLTQHDLDPTSVSESFINKSKGFDDAKAVLEGARAILMERFVENADLVHQIREYYWSHAHITSTVAKDKAEAAKKYEDYFEFSEAISAIPSHRTLALLRGRQESLLQLKVALPEDAGVAYCIALIRDEFGIPDLPATHWLATTVAWTHKIKLHLKLELEVMQELKQRADEEAIAVFSGNLKNLLLSSPAGNKVVLGLDPGYRTGVKTVVVDGTGKLLASTVIYPHAPQKRWDEALAVLSQLCVQHKVTLISIGNGTASRETDQLAAELLKFNSTLKMTKLVVSEAGASVYSASELAAKEFPDLDVSYRGAVSIARRLQDPLAELVKIDPKAIGVGQYQHDVNQVKLAKSLSATLEDCVNAVGADINTASVPLLTSISGLSETMASNIVQYREQYGRFLSRDDIKKVPRMGEKTFEQAVGFLRILEGDNPLDKSGVHPESYPVVEAMAASLGCSSVDLVGNVQAVAKLSAHDFVTEQFGLPTVHDILAELAKPGRDPRPEFKTATFTDGVCEPSDLKPGMRLEGVVTNVANFGAFVDVGVHQDGLVHVSQIADHFVKDLHQEVKVGQVVKVTVLEVDLHRKRISLSMKKNPTVERTARHANSDKRQPRASRQSKEGSERKAIFNDGLASQLQAALNKRG